MFLHFFNIQSVQVTVLEARDIPAADKLTGKSDPVVEIFTDTKHKVKTAKKSNTLHPVWEGEEHYLMVQVHFDSKFDSKQSSKTVSFARLLHLFDSLQATSCCRCTLSFARLMVLVDGLDCQ